MFSRCFLCKPNVNKYLAKSKVHICPYFVSRRLTSCMLQNQNYLDWLHNISMHCIHFWTQNNYQGIFILTLQIFIKEIYKNIIKGMIIQKWRHFTLKQDNSYKSNIPLRKEHQLIYINIPFYTCICNVIIYINFLNQ